VISCGEYAQSLGERLYGFQSPQAHGLQPKKDRRVRARDKFLRAAWRLMVAGEIYTERLVFLDECSISVTIYKNTEVSLLCPAYREIP
jgi:hypothetical protein